MPAENDLPLTAYQQPIDAHHWHRADRGGFLCGWTHTFEIGVDGSDGNSQTFDGNCPFSRSVTDVACG